MRLFNVSLAIGALMKLPPIAGITSSAIADESGVGLRSGGAVRALGVDRAPTPAADPQSLQQLADALNQHVGTAGQQLQFSVDHTTGKTVMRITDAESGALLRQIPGDEALSMARIMDKMQGMLIRQKA